MINLSIFVKNNTVSTDKKFSLFSPASVDQLDRIYSQTLTIDVTTLVGINKGVLVYYPYLLAGDGITQQFVPFDLPVPTLSGIADALNSLNLPADFSADNVNGLLIVGIRQEYANAAGGLFIYQLNFFSSISTPPMSFVSATIENSSTDRVNITVSEEVNTNGSSLTRLSTIFKVYSGGVLVPIQDSYTPLASNEFSLLRVAGVFTSDDIVTLDYIPASNPNNIVIANDYQGIDLYGDYSFTRMNAFVGVGVSNHIGGR